MGVITVSRDLLFVAPILASAERHRIQCHRIDEPSQLPNLGRVDLVIVNWNERDADWGADLVQWRESVPEADQTRMILVGSHTDLQAHAAAREAGLGPMWARSKLIADLEDLLLPIAPEGGR